MLRNEPSSDRCNECDGDGFVMEDFGGCGDPDCCGGPWKVSCPACHGWDPDSE